MATCIDTASELPFDRAIIESVKITAMIMFLQKHKSGRILNFESIIPLEVAPIPSSTKSELLAFKRLGRFSLNSIKPSNKKN